MHGSEYMMLFTMAKKQLGWWVYEDTQINYLKIIIGWTDFDKYKQNTHQSSFFALFLQMSNTCDVSTAYVCFFFIKIVYLDDSFSKYVTSLTI